MTNGNHDTGWDSAQRLIATPPEELMHAILVQVCDAYDPDSPHFAATPARFIKMLRELTDGTEDFTFTTFHSTANELVLIDSIQFVSVCSHHLAPFTGLCHIGYIPDGVIGGLSKFPRFVTSQARSLTNQEDLTANVADGLMDILEPLGLGVIMRAQHSCMSHRGALAHGTVTTTSAMRGVFNDHSRTAKQEFLTLLNGRL